MVFRWEDITFSAKWETSLSRLNQCLCALLADAIIGWLSAVAVAFVKLTGLFIIVADLTLLEASRLLPIR